jgi:2-iminobutanoate/2-iminopropanoate deaminase
MAKNPIISANGPKAVGPYSQGIVTDDFIFLSGQIPIDPATGSIIQGTVEQQTERAIQNIKTLLSEVGCDLKHVVKSTVFLVDLSKFSEMNSIYAKHFPAPHPARSTVQVAALPLGAQVEIEVIARKSA